MIPACPANYREIVTILTHRHLASVMHVKIVLSRPLWVFSFNVEATGLQSGRDGLNSHSTLHNIMNLLKKIGLTILVLTGLVASTTAQNSIIVQRNGQTILVVQVPRQSRWRVEPPHRHRAPRLPGRYDPVIHVFRRCK